MPSFIHPDFLLETEFARRLYHSYAAELPILDYHCHLEPEKIASNHRFADLTEIWLAGDHYKWRAMRTAGVSERFITGNALSKDKFKAWASTVPKTIGNPLFHWTHLELAKPFGCFELLNADTADSIFDRVSEQLQNLAAQDLLDYFKVERVGTTDDPVDSLEHHAACASKNLAFDLLPTFRPDKALNVAGGTAFTSYLDKLGQASGIEIDGYSNLLAALRQRAEHFAAHGCNISDHGLERIPSQSEASFSADAVLQKALKGQPIGREEADGFVAVTMLNLGLMYADLGWIMQLHLGAIRNNNSRLLATLGADCGVDSIGDFSQARGLAQLLDALDREESLPQTILYNLNPADNEVFATMCGNFNDGTIAGKVQFGSGWWFLDQKDGMEAQLKTLANLGLLSQFIGMLTDSRSFLSFPRHEYFRRILCNLLGDQVHRGLLPADEKLIGGIVADISYHNAKRYLRHRQTHAVQAV